MTNSGETNDPGGPPVKVYWEQSTGAIFPHRAGGSMQNDSHLLDIELGFGVQFERPNHNVYCPHCESEQSSKSPSCSVSINGYYKCQSCGARGYVTNFYATKHGIDSRQARDKLLIRSGSRRTSLEGTLRQIDCELSERRNRSSLSEVVVESTVAALRTSKWLSYIVNDRGLSTDSIARFDIGVDEYRITIPVYDEDGDLINIRRYHPHSNPKILNHILGDTRPSLFPMNRLDEIENGDTVVINEGEWDNILLWQNGFKALTNTGNAGVWLPEWTAKLVSDLPRCKFIVIFDVHDKKADYGQRMALKVVKELMAAGLDARPCRLDLPEKYIGGDITDYFVKELRTVDQLLDLIGSTEAIPLSSITHDMIHPPELDHERVSRDASSTIDPDEPFQTLAEASHHRFYHSTIRIRGLVAGKRVSPYIVPSRYTALITTQDGEESTIDRTIHATDAVVLQLLECSAKAQREVLKTIVGAPQNARVTIMIHETMNVEEVYLIPAVDHGSDEVGPYCMRTAYYIGHGLETNQVYEFRGITLPDPRSQAATHLLYLAIRAATSIDTFHLGKTDVEELRQLFYSSDVMAKLEDIADDHSHHVTRIYGRPDLHIAIDLAYHSPSSLKYDGLTLRKGWMELLVLGDTRTGKGFVTEGLAKLYRAGEVVSGENVSLAGLIGGLQKLGDRWSLVWGKVPLNDRRLVVIDEATGLSTHDIAKMSRVRSEGIAEITKIISEKTDARTRLIWLANPRSDRDQQRMIADYDHGIQAVPELVGAAEDVARFDLVLIVAQSEVGSATINSRHDSPPPRRYPTEMVRKLLAWAWSRRAEHFFFTEKAEDLILKASAALGHRFAPSVCLIQAEDVRFKLARIAAAAALRTFSTSDGDDVVVDDNHVTFAYNFMHYVYSKPCCGYADMSAILKERATLRDPKAVYAAMRRAVSLSHETTMMDLIDCLLEHRKITPTDLSDFTAIDQFQSRNIISELVRSRAIIKEHSYYIKKPAFKKFLGALKAKLAEGQHA